MKCAKSDHSLAKSCFVALLLATSLPVHAFASMLDPDNSFTPPASSATSSADSLKQELDNARAQAGSDIPADQMNPPPAKLTASPAPSPKPIPVIPSQVPALVTSPVPVPSPVAPAYTKTATAPKPYTTPEPVMHKEVVNAGLLDDTIDPLPTDPVKSVQPAIQSASTSQPVSYSSNTIAPAPSDLKNALFDDNTPTQSVKKVQAVSQIQPVSPAPVVQVPVTPVKDEMIAAPAKTRQPLGQISSGDDEMMPSAAPPAMPPAMPPAIQQVSSVPAMMPPPPLVTPASVAPVSVPAIEIRKVPSAIPSVAPSKTSGTTSSRFKPMPAKATGSWSVKAMPATSAGNDSLCLMQNRFDNNLALIIGQGGNGQTMLAVDYGIDMLDTEKPYTAHVEIDDAFSQDLPAYANSPQKLIIKLGKNPGFLSYLQSGQALHISLRGAASTFALNTISVGLNDLSHCLQKIGGQSMPQAAAVSSGITAQNTVAPSIPVAPIREENLAVSTPVSSSISPPPPIAYDAAPAPSRQYQSTWTDNAVNVMKQAGFTPYQLQKSDNQIQWQTETGALHVSARLLPMADLLDGASSMMDSQEKSCSGKFTSQMGVPDRKGSSDVLQIESKCEMQYKVMVSTWAIIKDAHGVTAWQMETTREERGMAFSARQQLLNAITR